MICNTVAYVHNAEMNVVCVYNGGNKMKKKNRNEIMGMFPAIFYLLGLLVQNVSDKAKDNATQLIVLIVGFMVYLIIGIFYMRELGE